MLVFSTFSFYLILCLHTLLCYCGFPSHSLFIHWLKWMMNSSVLDCDSWVGWNCSTVWHLDHWSWVNPCLVRSVTAVSHRLLPKVIISSFCFCFFVFLIDESRSLLLKSRCQPAIPKDWYLMSWEWEWEKKINFLKFEIRDIGFYSNNLWPLV